MANKTVKDAVAIRGLNPQFLIDKIIRTRIYDSIYWKEECFALTAERVVDKAMALKYVGGIYGGNIKPTPFLCLVLKLLQIQPEKEIIMEFIRNEEFKYVRALGAFYWRLVATSKEIFEELEPLYKDYRKILFQDKMGKFEVLHVDEYIDRILREERYCDVILPKLQKRLVLEETNELEPRVSALDDEIRPREDDESSEDEKDKKRPRPSQSDRRRETDRSPGRDRERRQRRRSPSSSSSSSSDSDDDKARRRRRSRTDSPPRRQDRERDNYRRQSPSDSRNRDYRRDDRQSDRRGRASPERNHRR